MGFPFLFFISEFSREKNGGCCSIDWLFILIKATTNSVPLFLSIENTILSGMNQSNCCFFSFYGNAIIWMGKLVVTEEPRGGQNSSNKTAAGFLIIPKQTLLQSFISLCWVETFKSEQGGLLWGTLTRFLTQTKGLKKKKKLISNKRKLLTGNQILWASRDHQDYVIKTFLCQKFLADWNWTNQPKRHFNLKDGSVHGVLYRFTLLLLKEKN